MRLNEHTLKYHRVKATFSYPSATARYLTAVRATDFPIPNEEGLHKIVEELEVKLKARDARFDTEKHLSVTFERSLGETVVSFMDGHWSDGLTSNDVGRSIL